MSTNSVAGLITVSSNGPCGRAMDILVLAVAQNLAENIVFRKFWLIQKIVHLDKYSLDLNVKNMISEKTNANDI